jgi:hypothetical protein
VGRQGRLLRGQVKKLWCLASTDGRIALLGSCMDKTRNIYVKSEIAEIFSAHQRLLGFVDAVSLGAIIDRISISTSNLRIYKIQKFMANVGIEPKTFAYTSAVKGTIQLRS